jgi:hypothetical protein
MATEILMPKLGLTMTEGTIDEWKKKVGDTVAKGEILLSVETDKLTNDVEAELDGVLLRIDVPAGETVACKNNSSRMFVTVWLGILELSTGRLTYTNAGHERPFVRGRDGVFRVFKDRHGLVVGAMPEMEYRDYELRLQPGDAIFVYTDGVPEANNAEGEFYGMERLEAALNRAPKESPQGILAAVKADVDAFVRDADQFDDMTMLCVEYRGAARREEPTADDITTGTGE